MDREYLLEIENPPLPPVKKVYDFYVTTIGGIEDVVLRDLREHLKQITQVKVEKGRRMGRIFFRYKRSPQKLLELQSVENVFALLADFGGVTVGQPGLLRIAKQVGKVDLIPAAVLHDILHGLKDQASFELSCTAGKRHRFSASELHHMVQAVLIMKYDLDPGNEPYHLHLQVQGRRALLGLRLSHKEQADRNYRLIQVDGDLPPSAAYCLSKLAQIRKHHVCLDARCGSGTTMIEIARNMHVRSLIGVEAYPNVLYAAQDNAQAAGVSARLAAADPEAFALRSGKVDRLICNLMRRSGEPPIGLGAFFQEVVRVLSPDGLAVLIAEDRQVIGQILNEEVGVHLLKRRTLHLRGRHLDVYILQKS